MKFSHFSFRVFISWSSIFEHAIWSLCYSFGVTFINFSDLYTFILGLSFLHFLASKKVKKCPHFTVGPIRFTSNRTSSVPRDPSKTTWHTTRDTLYTHTLTLTRVFRVVTRQLIHVTTPCISHGRTQLEGRFQSTWLRFNTLWLAVMSAASSLLSTSPIPWEITWSHEAPSLAQLGWLNARALSSAAYSV